MTSRGSVKTINSSFGARFLALTLASCVAQHMNLPGDLKCLCVWCGCSWPGPSWQPLLSICSIKKRRKTLVHFDLAQQRLCGLTGTPRSENSECVWTEPRAAHALSWTLAPFAALYQTFSCLLLLCTLSVADKDVMESKPARMAHCFNFTPLVLLVHVYLPANANEHFRRLFFAAWW